jgi:hypothetical protein
MSRVDLFSTIHKAIRRVLFELAADLARLQLTSTEAIDQLVCQVERALGLLDDHARLEDANVLVAVRELDPLLAEELARDHRSMALVEVEVEERAQELAMADLAGRPAAAARLAVVLHHLLALQLLHMNREETEVNRVLWASLDDAGLVRIAKASAAALPAVRLAEWQALVEAATSPADGLRAAIAS